jgi:hypothetical protein
MNDFAHETNAERVQDFKNHELTSDDKCHPCQDNLLKIEIQSISDCLSIAGDPRPFAHSLSIRSIHIEWHS